MKIVWINDHDLLTRKAGGAELTDSFMINYGVDELGFEIRCLRPHELSNVDLDDYDFCVLSNNSAFTNVQRAEILTRPHIIYCHDAQGWLRIYKNICPEIFSRSKLNIFLSPLHKKVFNNPSKSICIPPHMPDYIQDLGRDREKNKVIYIGNVWDGLKGANLLYDYIKMDTQKTFYFYFHRYLPFHKERLGSLKNTRMIGYIPHSQVSEELNSAEYFIHLPNDIEAFGRAVAEAYLSGCKIIGNNSIGAFSYEWSLLKDYFRSKTAESPKLFWDKVLGSI